MSKAKKLKIFPVGPSSPFDVEKYESGTSILKQQGFSLLADCPLRKSEVPYLNGSDKERFEELEKALNCDQDTLVWAARGGFGVTRLLPQVMNLKARPRSLVVGFSDITALMLCLWGKFGSKSLHAPVLTRLSLASPEVLEALWQILEKKAQDVVYPKFQCVNNFKQHKLSGQLLPVNLTLLTSLLGCEAMPDLTGTILLVEDTDEHPYKIDRQLTQLWNAGVLGKVKGVIAGSFDAGKKGSSDTALNNEGVFVSFFIGHSIPTFKQFPVGHEEPNWPVPFGVKAEVSTDSKVATLKLKENVF